MRRLGISYLKTGMKLGKAIYRADGRVVLGKGMVLNRDYITKLPAQGITSVYIEDERIGKLEINDILSEEIRLDALRETKKINEELALLYKKFKDEKIKENILSEALEKLYNRLHDVANMMYEDFIMKKNAMVNLIDTRLKEDYIYSHMVNTAALCLIIAKNLGYKEDKILEIIKSALIHDIGMIVGVSEEIRRKKGDLTDEEWVIIKTHSEIGYQFLKRIQGMGVLAAQAIYQHHERFNGGGYPRGLSKGNIVEYGYVLGIADVYDAVTNNRDYKRRMLPDKAREVLMGTVNNFFPLKIVEAFLKSVPAYPNGSTLSLSNNFEVVVVKQNPGNLSRPLVKVIKEVYRDLKEVYELDLMNEPSLVIKKILD